MSNNETIPLISSSSSSPDQSKTCLICYEEADDWFTVATCHHSFCKTCILKYLNTVLVEEREKLSNIYCPSLSCQGKTTMNINSIMEQLTQTDFNEWAGLYRALKKVDNPDLTECPQCAQLVDTSQSSVAASSSSSNNTSTIIQCTTCRIEFCSRHTLAHAPNQQACEAYVRLERESMDMVEDEECKRCPYCEAMVNRAAGCDHVKCLVCKNHWCWKCHPAKSMEGEEGKMMPKCQMCKQEFMNHSRLRWMCLGLFPVSMCCCLAWYGGCGACVLCCCHCHPCEFDRACMPYRTSFDMSEGVFWREYCALVCMPAIFTGQIFGCCWTGVNDGEDPISEMMLKWRDTQQQ